MFSLQLPQTGDRQALHKVSYGGGFEGLKGFRETGMAIPVNGSGAGSSATSFVALQDAIQAGQFADLANILDTLELEVEIPLLLSRLRSH